MDGQKQPTTSTKIEQSNHVLKKIDEILKCKDGKVFKKFIIDRNLCDDTIFWDVCSKVCVFINEENFTNNTVFFEACEMCLKYVVNEGNPKELILALLEQCEFFNDDIKFTTLLFLIQRTLLRLSSKRYHSLDLALETLTTYILEKPLPEDNALENEERKLLAMDKHVLKINEALKAFLQFLMPFVEEVSLKSSKSVHNENIQAQILILKNNLLKILGHPLIYLDLHQDSDEYSAKNNSRLCAETLMELLSHLETNFQKMMEFAVNKKVLTIHLDNEFRKTNMDLENEENERRLKKSVEERKDKFLHLKFDDIVSNHSLCCLSYLIFSERLANERLPCVYSNYYLFEFNLPFIVDMLKCTKSLLLFKGLKLLGHFVSHLPNDSIPHFQLDNDHLNDVIYNLIEVMTKCSMKDLRQEAVELFTGFIKLFVSEGRYQIYQNVLNVCKHSGVKGFVINLIKDEIKETLTDDEPNKSFVGQRLRRLVKMAIVLPEAETTDLLEHSDRIITVLNLLRYLVIRDPPKLNKTGIWNDLDLMETKFFKPLRIGLDMSKGHYDLELKKLTEGKERPKKSTAEFDMSVGGMSLPEMTKNDEISVMHSALNTFELMDSLFIRLVEIIDNQKTAHKKS